MFLMLEDLFLWKELGGGWKSISDLSRLSVEAMLLEIKKPFLVLWGIIRMTCEDPLGFPFTDRMFADCQCICKARRLHWL